MLPAQLSHPCASRILAEFAAHRANRRQRVDNLLAECADVVRAYENGRASRRSDVAPRFNLFRVLGIHRREVKTHSAALRFFLDPLAEHAQGNLFLNAFLARLVSLQAMDAAVLDPGHESAWAVMMEVPFGDGRLDIVMQNRAKGACIVIENKVDADDQPKQLLRYWRWLESKREGFPHRALIYLTPDGTPPSRQSMGVGRRGFQPALTESLVRFSYRRDIAGWLSGAGRGAPAAVQVFVNQYVELVRSI